MTEDSTVQRSITVPASPDAIRPWLTNFHRWLEWSPWEGIDPELKRTYSGPDDGQGARYTWSGNRKAGAGTMLITTVTDTRVDIDLTFTKPFASESRTQFDLLPDGSDATTVVWQLHTPRTLMMRVVGLVMNMDKTVGADLEKGLEQLRRLVVSA